MIYRQNKERGSSDIPRVNNSNTDAERKNVFEGDVLLFDAYASGHHVEYAAKLRQGLRTAHPEATVDFRTTAPHDKHDDFFEDDTVQYVFPNNPNLYESLSERPVKTRDRVVRAFADGLDQSAYDVVHFLQIDYLLRWIYKHFRDMPKETALAGSIVGSFFADRSFVNEFIAETMRLPLQESLLAVTPDNPSRNINLARCLPSVLDHVYVHSEAAHNYVTKVTRSEAVSVVPDPLDDWANQLPNQAVARDRLDLSTDQPILLMFGELREEKGISLLLNALEVYNGPPVTILIAGKPTDISEACVEEVARTSDATIQCSLGFIPQDDVPVYFATADGVLTPYLRVFGSERTSNVFQNAIGARRPVIAPRFGTFKRRVTNWNLGALFNPDSPSDLASTIASFAANPEGHYDPNGIEYYVDAHSYSVFADTIADVYLSIVE